MRPGSVQQSINNLVWHLVSIGLADDLQEAFQNQTSNTEISFPNARLIDSSLREMTYTEIFEYFVENRVFNVRFLDGAFVQMSYVFERNELLKHRLAFMPPPEPNWQDWRSPSLDDDNEFSDMLLDNRGGQPLRFDFDSSDSVHADIIHPKSHLTFSDFATCRIPVSSPLSPYWFLYFVVQNFYTTTTHNLVSTLPVFSSGFVSSITTAEQQIPHFVIPA